MEITTQQRELLQDVTTLTGINLKNIENRISVEKHDEFKKLLNTLCKETLKTEFESEDEATTVVLPIAIEIRDLIS